MSLLLTPPALYRLFPQWVGHRFHTHNYWAADLTERQESAARQGLWREHQLQQ